MLKKVVLGVAIVIALLVTVISMQPSTFRIERSAEIAAPPARVFALVNDFHQWPKWSPWEKRDPQLQREYSGPDAGVGATYEWKGNSDVGSGRMTITESRPPELVEIRLEFVEPFTATNQATFTFTPNPVGTTVRWSMSGANNFVGKAFSLLMDIDSMVGEDFEAGLQAMKAAAESGAS